MDQAMPMSKNNLAVLMAQAEWYKLSDGRFVCPVKSLISVLDDTNLLTDAIQYGLLEEDPIKVNNIGASYVAKGDCIQQIENTNTYITTSVDQKPDATDQFAAFFTNPRSK